jgi:glycosyltransferase involved in cell wall biosynthesis
LKIGYVVKRYPRHSETFVVNELLAHESAGEELEIFALRAPNDTHFQDLISQVRAPVRYLHFGGTKASTLWRGIEDAAREIPDVFSRLDDGLGLEAQEVSQAVQLAAHVRRAGIEHLHAHFATTASRVAALAAHLAQVSFTFTAHAKDIFHEDVADGELARLAERAAFVVTVSDYNVRYLSESCGVPLGKITRIYNGLPLDTYRFHDPAEAPRDGSILAVGRLVDKKGFRYLIDACALLAERGRPVPCVIIGGGECEDALRARIDELDVGLQVRLAGALPRVEVARAMLRASVFAAPCVIGDDGNRDGLPTVLLEAMASGTPCVSTDVTGIPEILTEGETGLLAKQEDAVSLAAAIERLLDDRELAARCARAARARIEQDFDREHSAAALRAEFVRASELHTTND